MDAVKALLIEFAVNNVVVTLFIAFGLFMLLRSGALFRSKAFATLILIVVLILLAPMGLQMLKASAAERSQSALANAPDFVLNLACRWLRLQAACQVGGMAQAATAAETRRATCIDEVLRANANSGGEVLRRACAAHEGHDGDWADCIARDSRLPDYAPIYAAVYGEPCSPGALRQLFSLIRDLVRPIACPFGIRWWCETP
ncbi:MAG: hypothetical protein JJU27_12320 [Gammaproteobacteria bacterium]|nr:hypothetical protein [Gammaproteobacteria bacterium]